MSGSAARASTGSTTDGSGADVVNTVQHPPVDPAATRTVRPGLMTRDDLDRYTAPGRAPTSVQYRGLRVVGMAPPSSGGSTVGEALNILEGTDLAATYATSPTQALHRYLEASALAFADRGKYVGAPASMTPGAARAAAVTAVRRRAGLPDQPAAGATKPVAAGTPDGSYDTDCNGADDTTKPLSSDQEGLSTTHLTTADRFGNVVAYTLTIEQTGGSGLTVPGRGFLLNNELTDFTLEPAADDPNAPGGGKRPRSSMAPTIVLDRGQPVLAVGSPGGSTIITTVLQVLLNRLDFGMSLPEAVAAPRASQRNTTAVQAEAAFDRTVLMALGHSFVDPASTR